MSAPPKRSLSFPARARNQRPRTATDNLTAAFTAARATAVGARATISAGEQGSSHAGQGSPHPLPAVDGGAEARSDEAVDNDVGTDGDSVTESESEPEEAPRGGEHAPEGGDGDNNQRSEAAVPVLKVGGKAEHPTLGEVSVLVLGALGAKIEFFSVLW